MTQPKSKHILEFERATRTAATKLGIYRIIELSPSGRKSKLYQAVLTASNAKPGDQSIWESLLYSVVADAKADAKEHFAKEMKALALIEASPEASPEAPQTQPELPLKADDAPVEVPVEELPAVAPEELPELTIENSEPAPIRRDYWAGAVDQNDKLEGLRFLLVELNLSMNRVAHIVVQHNRPCRYRNVVVSHEPYDPSILTMIWGPIMVKGKSFKELEDEFDRQYLASDFNSVRVP